MLSLFVFPQLVIRTHRTWPVASQFLRPNSIPALTPVESADPQNALVTLLQSADPKTRHLKSFGIRTYKIRRGEGAAVGFFAVPTQVCHCWHNNYLCGARRTSVFSRNRYSMPVPRNVSIASRGVFTMGWPFTLKLVFRTISRRVTLPTALRSS